MSQIEAMTLIPELKAIVVGSSDNNLRIFRVSQNKVTSELECNFVSQFRKESNNKVIEI